MLNEFLSLPAVYPYMVAGVIALTLLVVFGLLTIIGIGMDFDLDFGGIEGMDVFTRWMGVSSLPVSVIIPVSFTVFSVVGLSTSSIIYGLIGIVPAIIHVPNILLYVVVSRYVFRAIGKIWPEEVSTASYDAAELFGKEAIVHESATEFRLGSVEMFVNGNKVFLNVLAKEGIVEVGRTVTIYDYRDSFYIVSY